MSADDQNGEEKPQPASVVPDVRESAELEARETDTRVVAEVADSRISAVTEDEDEEADDDEVESIGGDSLEFVADDPLAPAYDLETEEVLDKDDLPERLPWRSEVRSAKEFFSTEILYRFDIIEPPDRVPMEGRYRIELRGANGGVWSLKITEDLEIVNRKEDADVVLILQQRDFMQIINGTLNPQLAILAQKLKIQGNVQKAVLLQNILAPAVE